MYSNGFLKVAAASPVSRVGDPMFNVKEMLKLVEEAKLKEASFICFPELCVSGYSIGDLVFQKYLYDDCLEAIKYFLRSNTFKGVVIFGAYVFINDVIYNCSFITQKKKILGIVPKIFLPNTHEFNEARWFASGADIIDDIASINFFDEDIPFGKIIFATESGDVNFATEVCSDLWAPISPHESLYANGALICFNLSASPAYVGKKELRKTLTKSASLKFNGGYVYVSNNSSESTSDVVFSGHKLICENGVIIAESEEINLQNSILYGDFDILQLHHIRRNNNYYKNVQWLARDTNITRVIYELEELEDFTFEKNIDPLPFVPKKKEEYTDIINIQATSVIKRLEYIGINKVVIGVSGGLDSTLALLSLCYAFDKYNISRENIIAYALPSKATSERTYKNSMVLLTKLGVTIKEINIYTDVLRQLKAIGHDSLTKDVTFENVQARFRTYTLMNAANLYNAIVIGTSDMSEIALGWSTFGGDHMAMYAINAGLPKTVVRETVRHFKEIYLDVADVIEDIITTPITPELTDAKQSTEDIIGKYEVNDFILYHFLKNGDDTERIAYLLFKAMDIPCKEARELVVKFNKRFYSQQFKRLTSPESVKIMSLSLSPRTELKLNGDIYRVENK
ncbi:MAG TPA: NAD(+) synthase [Bacilli bacterium]|nr:NAD(+) synthase [Bacilli bacterium]